MKKSQISVSFLFVVAMILFLFAITITITFDKREEVISMKNYLQKTRFCSALSDYVHLVYIGGDGLSMILNSDYNVVLNNKIISVDDVLCNSLISLSNINLNEGLIYIENKKGEIMIKNV